MDSNILQKNSRGLKKSFFCRLSLALEPNTEKMNTAPGMGLKFLRDGVDSANLVADFADCPNQLICLTLFFLHWLGGHVLCGRPGVVELLQERLFQSHPQVWMRIFYDDEEAQCA